MAVCLTLDQVVKSIVENSLRDGHSIELIFGARFVLTYNSGAAFSVGAGRSGFFTVMASIVVTVLFIYAVWARQRVAQAVAFGLILAGAGGNLFDRLFRDNGGRVIDFIQAVDWWPVFNVADIWLFCGVAVMLVMALHEDVRRSSAVRRTGRR